MPVIVISERNNLVMASENGNVQPRAAGYALAMRRRANSESLRELLQAGQNEMKLLP
jgi:hypothetical protein